MVQLRPNPSWLSGVEYDVVQRCHRVDGRRVPSVTQALTVAYPDRFAAVPPAVLAHKAAIGTAVHQAAHYHAEHDLHESSMDVEVTTRFAAWKWFTESRRVRPLLCEAVVCSRDLGLPMARRRPYIGKLDFLCVVDSDTIVLLDIKTGKTDLAGLQTLAYLDALYQQYPQLIAVDVERWAVQLTANERHVIHTFRDDSTDARDFREALEKAYAAPDVEWRTPMAEMPMFELPDEGDLLGSDLRGPAFDLPDEPEVLPAPDHDVINILSANVVDTTEPPGIRELLITPDIEAYLSMLETAIAPYEATAKAFAEEMKHTPIDTPQQLAILGQQSLVAKSRENLLDELFEPAIRKPRLYLDRVYALKRRVVSYVKTGGETAATRYTLRKRELEDIDRLARLEADRRQREAQQAAEAQAAAERRRLALEATQAAQQGNAAAVADLIAQARAVEPVPVPVAEPPPALAPAAAVAGLGERLGWEGIVTDIKIAVMASARPDIFREVAALVEAGDLTAGGHSLTTEMIAAKLRTLAADLPVIPSVMFIGHDAELKKRAAADRDTLQWPGFEFKQTFTPVRRTTRART